MFRVCDAAILNKIDLLPYLDYNREEVLNNIRQVHPEMPVFELSAKTGDGFTPWIEWLKKNVGQKKN